MFSGELVAKIDPMRTFNPHRTQAARLKKEEPGIVLNDSDGHGYVFVLWNDGTITTCWSHELSILNHGAL
jgi:hypothetical protein